MMTLDYLNKVISHDLDRRRITIQAGMRLWKFLEELEKRGWCLDNLGSITDQSMAGAISTGTHGSSLEYGVISNQVQPHKSELMKVEEITLVLADGTITTCSLENDPDLFRAALISLGSLGVIIRITFRGTPKYNLAYTTETISLPRFLSDWETIWTSAEYVRAWWWPYNRKVIIWRGNRTQSERTPSPFLSQSPIARFYANLGLGKKAYESSLYALTYLPSLIPNFEKILFRSQFPAKENMVSDTIVDNPHSALQMDCYFSQYVDEWAISLSKGPEAITRLDRWISTQDTTESGIPIDTDGRIFVHAPIEFRVNSGKGDHAFLSPAGDGNPVVYIGVIMYRPYYRPVTYRRYFTAYEHLMRLMGGKPHWAKQHRMSASEARSCFGEGFQRWLDVRKRVDPTGVFVNGFVKRHLLGETEGRESKGVGTLEGESGRLYKRFKAVL
jgi:D-arabinono-1,4-lactone oxidase